MLITREMKGFIGGMIRIKENPQKIKKKCQVAEII
jgi:hypothetical protein